MTQIAEQSKYSKQYKTINGKKMAYIDTGQDDGNSDPIVFLHGNPTSSFLWRNIMPHLEGRGRLIAPDLIGMGDSEKLDDSGPDSYRYVEHRKYLFALLEELGVKDNVTLVVHDWGSGLGFHWAHQHPKAVKGIAFMEAIVAPVQSWSQFPEAMVPVVQGMRSAAGETMVLEQNIFIEDILPSGVLRKLSDAEMAEYRRPYVQAGESRRPLLTFPRQLPIAGQPEDVVAIVSEYSQWLSQSDVPKLLVNAEPGILIVGPVREWVRTWPNTTEVTVSGAHFIQEDSPHEIGEAIAAWHAKLG